MTSYLFPPFLPPLRAFVVAGQTPAPHITVWGGDKCSCSDYSGGIHRWQSGTGISAQLPFFVLPTSPKSRGERQKKKGTDVFLCLEGRDTAGMLQGSEGDAATSSTPKTFLRMEDKENNFHEFAKSQPNLAEPSLIIRAPGTGRQIVGIVEISHLGIESRSHLGRSQQSWTGQGRRAWFGFSLSICSRSVPDCKARCIIRRL